MLMLDATTSFRTGRSTSASSSTAVPTEFADVYSAISYIDCPTPTRAARCTTASTPSSARRTASRVADVADLKLDVRGEILRPAAVAVHLRLERVERPHTVPAREQLVGEMRADEARAARDQDLLRQRRARRARLRNAARPPCPCAPT